MKNRMSLAALLVTLCLPGFGRGAEDALRQAVDYARAQRDAAAAMVASAKARVDAATGDVDRGEAALVKAQLGRNVVAEGVAREAIKEAAAGVADAGVLLQRATLLLNDRNNTLLRLQAREGRQPAPHALVLPGEGTLRRFAADGSAVTDPLAPLQAGDRIETGAGSAARLFLAGGAAEGTLGADSSFRLVSDSPGGDFLAELRSGTLRLAAHIKGWSKKFEVRTPVAVCAVRGTEFSLTTLPEGLRVGVHEGVVTVTPAAGGDAVEVHAGEQRDYIAGKGFGPVQALPAAADGGHAPPS